MDPHLSWYHFIPGYQSLHDFFQHSYDYTVLFNGGLFPENKVFETVHHIFAAALVVLVLMVFSLMARRKLSNLEAAIIPSPKMSVLNFFEVILELLLGTMRDIIGSDYRRHVPMVGTLALFILFSNLLGLVPGFIPPTDNLNTTLACGLFVFLYFNFQGLRVHGISHITHLANPIGIWWGWFLAPLLFPVEFISLCVRPLSLAIRLAGNMIGDHKVLVAFSGLMPLIVPLPFFFLGFLVSLIQTVVFCLLTCVYISLHTQEAAH